MNRIVTVLIGAMLLGTACQSWATDRRPLQTEMVLTQQMKLRPDLQAGKGAYAKLTPDQRTELLAQQDRLQQLLQGKRSSDELDEAGRREAFAAVDALQAATAASTEERMVCTRQKTIGSNRTTRVCKTEAQIEEERREARENIDRRGICRDCLNN